ncbi:MAG: DUF87 domain-containing protein [bacterium]
MKYFFNFFENIFHFGELIGFLIAKGINKFFYGLFLSSFDESKEHLKIEQAKLENMKKELENQRKELEIESKKYQDRIADIEILLKAENIDKETFVTLQEENKKLKEKINDKDKIIKDYKDKEGEINMLRQYVMQQQSKMAITEKNNKTVTLNALEYKRLQEQIGILESEIKVLKSTKEYVGETIQSKAKEVLIPKFEKSRNPIKLIKNYLKFRKEMSEFKKLVNEYIKLDKDFDNKKSKKYKMESIKEADRLMEIGDKFVRVYYLADLPNVIFATTLFKIINLPIPLTLSYHIKGTNKGAMIKAARQRLSVLESILNERARKGKSTDHGVDREMEEVNTFITNLTHDIERTFLISVYAMITADSKKELLEYDQKFQDETGDIEFTFNTYTFGQQKILDCVMPLAQDSVKENSILQTSAVANMLPFLTRNLNDPTGIFIGTNHYNSSLVLIDLFKARNANMNIFGTSGSGKSVTSKIIMERLVLRGVQIIILDPEGEYGKLAKSLGGEVIEFNRENGINPFFIGNASNDSIRDHVGVLKNFFSFFIQEKRHDTAKLDKLLMRTYESGNPVFSEFMDIVKKEAKVDKDINFVEDLEQLQNGSLSGIFSSEKSINLNADVICFDLSQLTTDEKKIPAMYLLGTIINRLIDDKSGKRRMIFIDEAHKLLVNEATTQFYVDLVKTARKRKAGVVSITQNPEDFKEGNNSKTILTQAETSILLKQAPASINFIKRHELFKLTEREMSDLPTFGIGEVLFIREREHIYMDIFPFESEKELVFTS